MSLGAPITTPPRWVIRVVMSVRAFLHALADALVPRQLVMAERVTGYAQAELIRVAARLRIADLLADGPKTAADLAAATAVDGDSLDRSLRALVQFGVFRHTETGFENNRLSTALRADSPGSWRSFALAMTSPAIRSAWSDLETTVRTGQSAFERVHGRGMWDWLGSDVEARQSFAEAMTAQTQMQAHALARSPAFAGIERLCDVGGGHGALLVEVLSLHAKMQGVLFDRPEVVEGARASLSQGPLANRIEIHGGDLFERVPEGCDGYVLKNILHNWNDERGRVLLRNVRRAVKPGARLLVIEMLRDRPLALAPFSDMQMMVVHEGRERDIPHFEQVLEATGFVLQRSYHTRTLFDVLEAEAR
jgi:SAM-dependent methyltransferase